MATIPPLPQKATAQWNGFGKMPKEYKKKQIERVYASLNAMAVVLSLNVG